jgi:hypothetical protein
MAAATDSRPGFLLLPVGLVALLVVGTALYTVAQTVGGLDDPCRQWGVPAAAPPPPTPACPHPTATRQSRQDALLQLISLQGLTLVGVFLGVWGVGRRDGSPVTMAALVFLLKAGILATAWSPVFFVEAPAALVFGLAATQLGRDP